MDDVSLSQIDVNDKHFGHHVLKDSTGELPLDVYQTAHSLVILAPVSGVEATDLDIVVSDKEVLTIRGNRSVCRDIQEDDFLTRECFWGAFSRSIVLPVGLDVDKIGATFKRGVLKIEVPKIKRSSHKK